VKTMQANWIGKSHGVNIGFPYELAGEKKVLRVFTTRADTLMAQLSVPSPPSTRSPRTRPGRTRSSPPSSRNASAAR